MNDKKELIIKSFVNLYRVNKNYETISLKAIAKEAGIGKSTIYEYFDNKEDLIAQTLVYSFNKATSNVLELDQEGLNFEDSLRSLLHSLLFKSEEVEFIFNVKKIDVIAMASKTVKDDMLNKVNDFKDQVRERFNVIFVKGIIEGKVTEELLKKNYLMINSLVFGSIRVFQVNHEDIEVDKFVEDLIKTILLIANN